MKRESEWRVCGQSDSILISNSEYGSLTDLRCPVYRVSMWVFLGMIRRLKHEGQHSGVVLDCRGRDQVEKKVLEDVVASLGSVAMTERLPQHQHCTEQKRQEFRDWLRSVTHLRDCFCVDLLPALKSLTTGSFLVRILKYLVKSNSKPKSIILLDAGLLNVGKFPAAWSIFNLPFPLYVVNSPRKTGGGLFVVTVDTLRNQKDFALLTSAISSLRITHIFNVSPAPIPPLGIQVDDVGPRSLPLKDMAGAQRFYTDLWDTLSKIVKPGTANVLLIDNQTKGTSALLCAMLFVGVARETPVAAIQNARDKLSPPEFDGFASAALSHLTSSSKNGPSRAIQCLAERFRQPNEEAPTTTSSPTKSPQATEILLRGATKPSLSEQWAKIETQLQAIPKQDAMVLLKMIEGIFNNVLLHPEDDKYRQLKSANPRFAKFIHSSKAGVALMQAGGWLFYSDAVWRLPKEANLQLLRDILVNIASTY